MTNLLEYSEEIQQDFYSEIFDCRSMQGVNLSDEDIRYEQIGYDIFVMPTPTSDHENFIMQIGHRFISYLQSKPCQVYGSNIGINLDKFISQLRELVSVKDHFEKRKGGLKEERVFLLPDLSIQCEKDGKFQSTAYGYPKVPLLVAEVSSLSNYEDDIGYKKDIYELIGVPEYWIIHTKQKVSVYILKDGKYQLTIYQVKDGILEVPVFVFPDLVITFDW